MAYDCSPASHISFSKSSAHFRIPERSMRRKRAIWWSLKNRWDNNYRAASSSDAFENLNASCKGWALHSAGPFIIVLRCGYSRSAENDSLVCSNLMSNHVRKINGHCHETLTSYCKKARAQSDTIRGAGRKALHSISELIAIEGYTSH